MVLWEAKGPGYLQNGPGMGLQNGPGVSEAWRDPAGGLLCFIQTEPGEVSKLSVFTEIRLLLAISS